MKIWGSRIEKEVDMKILVAFDGSEVTRKAVSLAEEHAQVLNDEIILVHSMMGGPNVPRKDFELAENILEYEKNQLLEKKIPCVSVLSVRGMDAGEDLVQLAEEKKVDEIIIGIKKKSKVEKLVFGSTAQHVILNAPCPVVSVK
jgi:nucleotide-binding universal stress UspA family protein